MKLALGFLLLYSRGGQLLVSGTWICIVIFEGWTVTCIWYLDFYCYIPGVDSYLYLVLVFVLLYSRGGQLLVSGTCICILIFQGWTVTCIWYLDLYCYIPGVDSYFFHGNI